MAKFRITAVVAATSVLLLPLFAPAMADTTVTADLQPTNDSGASGTATLTATDDGQLTVVVRVRGLVPGQPHAQHIHGSVGGGHFMCPSMADDSDGDGILTNEEAAGEYGTIFLSLTTRGDVSPGSGLALERMPVADSSGRFSYSRTITAEDVPPGLLNNLSEVHVVQHGIDVNDNDRYDLSGLGESTFAKNLGVAGVPEEATNPATCGVITGAGAQMPSDGGVETGGGPGGQVNILPAALGGLFLLLSTAALFARRRRPVRLDRGDG